MEALAPSSPSAKINVNSVGADTMDSASAATVVVAALSVVDAAGAVLPVVLSSVLPQPANMVIAIAATRTLASNFFLIVTSLIPCYIVSCLCITFRLAFRCCNCNIAIYRHKKNALF